MKNLIFCVLQFILFFVVFGAFSLFPPIHIQQVISTTANDTRSFIWDGLILSLLLAIVILVIEAVRGRIRKAGPWTTAAFVLSTIVGLVMSFGFKTVGH
ncbi:MAG TPA: hypothetical protein VG714_06720 [Acidobacteriaceae bacterium]|nr:hypothetical protein [Acidobacteriaceae bacterium]